MVKMKSMFAIGRFSFLLLNIFLIFVLYKMVFPPRFKKKYMFITYCDVVNILTGIYTYEYFLLVRWSSSIRVGSWLTIFRFCLHCTPVYVQLHFRGPSRGQAALYSHLLGSGIPVDFFLRLNLRMSPIPVPVLVLLWASGSVADPYYFIRIWIKDLTKMCYRSGFKPIKLSIITRKKLNNWL